jgi:hypothetical protein
LYATTGAFVTITNSSFFSNKVRNNGGCLSNAFSRLYVYNSTFKGCEAKGKGGTLFGSETFDQVMANCTVLSSHADSGSVISAYLNSNFGGSWKIEHCIFANNTSANELFQVSETMFLLKDCVIIDSLYNIFTLTDAEVTVINSIFLKITCLQNLFGCLFSANRCLLTLSFILAENVFNQVESAGVSLIESDLKLSDSILRNFSSNMESAFLFGQFQSKIQLSYNQFMHFRQTGLWVSESELFVNYSSFDNIEYKGENLGSAINCISCSEVSVKKTNFSNIRAILGGGIYIGGEDTSMPIFLNKVIISSCEFENNVATKGGAIYLSGGFTNISSSIFINNSASFSGGALYYITATNSSLEIKANNFTNNWAIEGSAIKWAYVRPLFNSNIIINPSSLETSSNNLVSFPVSLRVEVKKFNQSADENLTLLQEIPSGLPLNFEFKLEVIDTDLELFEGAQEAAFNIAVRKSYNFSISSSIIDDIFLFGENSIRMNKGIIDFSKLTFAGRENISGFIFFSFEGIPQFYTEYLRDEAHVIDKPANLNANGKYLLRIPIKFRNCLPGEIFNEKTLTCGMCPIGRYSFHPSEDCRRCPEGEFF